MFRYRKQSTQRPPLQLEALEQRWAPSHQGVTKLPGRRPSCVMLSLLAFPLVLWHPARSYGSRLILTFHDCRAYLPGGDLTANGRTVTLKPITSVTTAHEGE